MQQLQQQDLLISDFQRRVQEIIQTPISITGDLPDVSILVESSVSDHHSAVPLERDTLKRDACRGAITPAVNRPLNDGVVGPKRSRNKLERSASSSESNQSR